MRKVLFWILIIILLFLLFVLGYAFRKKSTPINVLKQRFGVTQTIEISSPTESDTKTFTDTTEQIKDIVAKETSGHVALDVASGTQTNASGQTLSQKDKEDVQHLIDSLIVK